MDKSYDADKPAQTRRRVAAEVESKLKEDEVEFDNDRYCTSKAGLAPVREFWPQGITLDPCCDDGGVVGASHNFDIRKGQDALKLSWAVTPGHVRVFLNPRYSDPRPFTGRALHQVYEAPDMDVIGLVPPKVGTKWFHTTIWRGASALCFLEGRLSFLKQGKIDPNPRWENCYVLWASKHDAERHDQRVTMFERIFSRHGQVCIL